MRLTSITITDLAAFAGTVAFPFSAVSVIQGDHGVGKSSLMLIVEYAFGRRPLAESGARGIAHDPSIIHGTCERGEATIIFDDQSTYRVAVTAETTTRQTKVAGGKRWNTATPEFIDALVNALSYDPFTFKDLDEKKRVEALLKASPVTVSAQEIITALDGTNRAGGARVAWELNPSLESVNALYSELYQDRRDSNVAADTQRKHAEELEKAVGPEVSVENDLPGLRAKKEELERSLQSTIKNVGDTFRQHQSNQESEHSQRKAAIDLDINARIADLERERIGRHQGSGDLAMESIEEARALANKAVNDKRAEVEPEIARLTADIATAEERARASAHAEGTREAAARARTEEREHRATSERIDAAMTRLATLKESAAGRLAIKGITIAAPRAGQPVDICREEKGALVPFSRWNQSDQELFCLRIAVLYHGKCGVVFVDEIGHFTEERKAALMKTAQKYAAEGMQFIFGEATGGELRVVEA